jgi:hypothetical protein
MFRFLKIVKCVYKIVVALQTFLGSAIPVLEEVAKSLPAPAAVA